MAIPKFGGVMTVMGSVLIHLSLGTIFTFGNMMTYFISYMRIHVDSSLTYEDSLWVYALSSGGQGLLMSVAGMLERRFGPRRTILLGGLLMCLGVMSTYWTVKTSLVLVVLTYGLLYGIGIGFAYVSTLATGMRWFPRRKGLVNGLVLSGFGLGSLIFNQVQTFFLNPNNISVGPTGYFTDNTILDRVPSTFLLLAACYASLQILGVCLITDRPLEEAEEEENLIEQSGRFVKLRYGIKDTSGSGDLRATCSLTPSQVLRTPQFYQLWMCFFLIQQAVAVMTTMYKSFGQEFISDDHFLSLVGSLSSVENAFGRIIWGVLCDWAGFKVCIQLLQLILAALFAILMVIPLGGKALYALWVWATYFVFSGVFSMLPTATTLAFGPAHAATNYGMVFTQTVPSNLFLAFGVKLMFAAVGWFGLSLAVSACLLLGALIMSFYPEDHSCVRGNENTGVESANVNSVLSDD